MSSIVKTTLIVLVIAGIGFFGYNYLSRTTTTGDVLTQQDLNNTSKMGAEVLTALNQLKTLKLDSSVFKDKTFISLKDFSKPLNAEPVGRPNPFSPIGVEKSNSTKTGSSTSATTTKTTNTNTSGVDKTLSF